MGGDVGEEKILNVQRSPMLKPQFANYGQDDWHGEI